MSRFLRSTAMKVVIVLGLVVLTTGGVLLGIEGTSGAGPAAAPAVDHQLCYSASATGFKVPPASRVRLIDQFAPNGIVPIRIGPLAVNCNPVVKTVITPAGGKKVTPVTNPNAHLACFPIGVAKQPTKTVRVTNQFGTGFLNVGQPTILCLPSWKSLTGPPKETTAQPPGLNHFTCYSVTYLPGSAPFKVPGTVSLRDEFAPKAVTVKVGAPELLCLPTEKIITSSTGSKTYRIINAAEHLLCFAVSKTPIKSPVFDLNQFGFGKVTIKQTSTLCLPSLKKVIKTG